MTKWLAIAVVVGIAALPSLFDGIDGPLGNDPQARTPERAEPGPRTRVRACDMLPRRLARQFVGKMRPVDERRAGPLLDSCTYLSRRADRSVTVSVYPREKFGAALRAVPGTRTTREFGDASAFNNRLGYLVRLPNRPYYLQVTFMHVAHLHADRRMSRTLTRAVVLDRASPKLRFICSLDGRRST